MDLNFKQMVELSLDKDIAGLFKESRINTMEAMTLQLLRLAWGKAFVITSVGTTNEGWTPDGVTWLPKQPGA
jgi:hypothetical protein